MAIRIVRNEQGNCINFYGSSNPTYWNACLSGEVDSTDTNSINIINDIITSQTGTTQYEFFRVPYTEFVDAEGNGFANAQDTADYITEKANVVGLGGGGTDLTDEDVCFKLDDTSTSIMLDNGHSYGVNTIKAVNTGDGLITIQSELGDIIHFTKLDHTKVCDGDGVSISGGLNDVINYLNELFTVGAFESVVISDPYSTMVADVDGEDTSVTYIGYGLDPVGNDIYGSTSTNSQNGLLSTETIDQAGEYFTFDIRNEGTIGFGLVHTQASYDAGLYSGSATYADPTRFGIDNSAHYGFQFSHWFHPTPNGSWTNYGANTSYSMRAGWSNFNGTQEQTDWLNGDPIKVRVGIDENGYISIDTLRNGSTWVAHSRTSYPVPQGSEYRLGIKTNHTGARVFSLPKVHLLEPEAPTMYFRYIESPDGVFHYPLFTTAEEAEYYDEIHNGLSVGTGSSHTHTYADDPTNTTWYMPEATHDASTYQHSSAPSGNETFSGNAITYTEVTSLTNADLTPPQFSSSDYTYEEGTIVNLQVTPQGASWSTSVSITPSGSGLVYDGYSLIQGTLNDVSTDTTYTVSVTRANSYGSNIGTFEIQATDVAPVQTNSTPWTKALDFSGSSEHLKQVSSSMYVQPLQMNGLANTVDLGTSSQGDTSNNTSSRPWATAVVFKADGYSGNQMIWNQGEGSSSGNDNIFVNVTATGHVNFGWGREGYGYNMCKISTGINFNDWYGISIAHNGVRLGGNNATASNLADCFDIRIMSSADSFASISSNLSTSANWTSTGQRMDRTVAGDFTIGGRGNGYSFRGKVASMVVTTLLQDVYTSAQMPAGTMPDADQAKMMITDPIKWVDDYKVRLSSGNPNGLFRKSAERFATNYYTPANAYQSTLVWLMGDGTSDSYSNGIRNYVYPSDQNSSKIQLNSMVSNDIETVNINGLT
jgi:hypothetical protein